MILPRPTAQQERWLAAAARCKVASNDPEIAERTEGWRSPSLIARCALFVLGVVAASLTTALFELFSREAGLPLAGVVLLIAAECLIRQKRLFHAGVEEALWTAGFIVVVMRFAPAELGWSIAAALLLTAAAVRLLNPLLLALACAAASAAIEISSRHLFNAQTHAAVGASVFCYCAGALALFLARIRVARPSVERMLNWLMITMPVCGFLWLVTQPTAAIRVGTGLASGVFAAAALVAGIKRRSHAALLAGMASIGCLAYQLRDLTSLPLKFKLILWGGVALLAAIGLDRHLRTPRGGITSRRVGEGSEALDLLQWTGTAALSPAATPQNPAFKGGGGNFSGGGAGGSY